MTKQEVLHFLQSYSNSGSALGLSRVELLLDYLQHPQKDLKMIHVAGTNGKGSTIAFLSSVLTEEGYRVGRFQSPWVFDYEEQIRIGEENISEPDFVRIGQKVMDTAKQMVADGHEMPTEFEMLFPMALLYFKEKNCDIVLVEVGLGGEGDATNVIPTPLISIITKISFDHMNYLGDTLEKIATAKAGIIKPLGKVLLASQQPEAKEVFDQKIKSVKGEALPLLELPNDVETGMKGEYQKENAALAFSALMALKSMGYSVSEEGIRRGMKKACWPGRFELLAKEPLFIIDGAHNEDGVRALAQALKQDYPGKEFCLIVGILGDKAYDKMLDIMLPFAKKAVCVTPPNPRALPGEELGKVIAKKRKDLPIIICKDLKEALEKGYFKEKEDTLAFGSLYYIGRLRKEFLLLTDEK